MVNIGDCLSDWSGGLLQSTLHRVALPIRNSDDDCITYSGSFVSTDRAAVAYFASPNYDAGMAFVTSFLLNIFQCILFCFVCIIVMDLRDYPQEEFGNKSFNYSIDAFASSIHNNEQGEDHRNTTKGQTYDSWRKQRIKIAMKALRS